MVDPPPLSPASSYPFSLSFPSLTGVESSTAVLLPFRVLRPVLVPLVLVPPVLVPVLVPVPVPVSVPVLVPVPLREQQSSVIAGSPSPLPPVSDLARVLCLQKPRFSPNHPFLPLVSDHNLSCAHYRNIWINSYLTASFLHCLIGFTQNNSTILSNMMRE